MKTRWIRELFSFSGKERTGIIVLLFVIFVLIIIWKMIPFFIPEDKPDFSKWDAEVNAFLSKSEEKIPVRLALHPVPFDPNEVDSVGLVNMGLPPKLAANWAKYVLKGGRFRNKDGVKKIFGMTPELFEQLDSFIVIPLANNSFVKTWGDTPEIKSRKEYKRDTIIREAFAKKEKPRVMMLELNSTDSLHLLAIPGIGPVFASRIIRYRNLLGGYYAVSQLREVYGMREDNFNAVSQYFTANPSVLKTFNINFATIQELGRHPYVGFKTARRIFKLRDEKGKFTSSNDLSSVVAEDSLKRLVPYLKFAQ